MNIGSALGQPSIAARQATDIGRMVQSRAERAKSKRPRACDAQNFDVPPPPNGELVVLLVLLPNMLPPVLLLLLEPKMLPPVFALEPKPGDGEGKLDVFELWLVAAHGRPCRESAQSLEEREDGTYLHWCCYCC